jgi:hypothetical protein
MREPGKAALAKGGIVPGQSNNGFRAGGTPGAVHTLGNDEC